MASMEADATISTAVRHASSSRGSPTTVQAPTATGKPVNMTCDPVTLLWPPTPLDVQARPALGPRARCASADLRRSGRVRPHRERRHEVGLYGRCAARGAAALTVRKQLFVMLIKWEVRAGAQHSLGTPR
jgi:hypothetical protein